MTTSGNLILAIAALVLLGCGTTSSNPDASPGSVIAAPTLCNWIQPMPVSDALGDVGALCDEGCTAVFARERKTQIEHFVACVPDDALSSEGVLDAEFCLKSSADHREYLLANSRDAQGVAAVCWIPCNLDEGDDSSWTKWLESVPEDWEEQCRGYWEAT